VQGNRHDGIHRPDTLKSAASVASAEMMTAKASVLNAKILNNYVNAMGDQPLCTVITEIKNQPDKRSQYKLDFDPEPYRADDAVMSALAGRVQEAQKSLLVVPVKVEKAATTTAAHPGMRKRKF
jgi:hypothetical protein